MSSWWRHCIIVTSQCCSMSATLSGKPSPRFWLSFSCYDRAKVTQIHGKNFSENYLNEFKQNGKIETQETSQTRRRRWWRRLKPRRKVCPSVGCRRIRLKTDSKGWVGIFQDSPREAQEEEKVRAKESRALIHANRFLSSQIVNSNKYNDFKSIR